MGNAVVAYCRYLGKTVWPERLAVFYPFPAEGWPLVTILLAGLVLAGITIAAVIFGKRRGYLPVGWFWFLGTLVPVHRSGAGRSAIHGRDRYSYIPSIGLLLAIVWIVAEARGTPARAGRGCRRVDCLRAWHFCSGDASADRALERWRIALSSRTRHDGRQWNHRPPPRDCAGR